MKNFTCKQECIPVGYVPSAAVAAGGWWGGGVCPGWCLTRGGVCPGGCLPVEYLPRRGLFAQEGVSVQESRVWLGVMSAQRGVYPVGCLPRGSDQGCVCLGGCLTRGCLPSGVSAQRIVCRGGVWPGGVCPEGCLPRGMGLTRAVSVKAQAGLSATNVVIRDWKSDQFQICHHLLNQSWLNFKLCW